MSYPHFFLFLLLYSLLTLMVAFLFPVCQAVDIQGINFPFYLTSLPLQHAALRVFFWRNPYGLGKRLKEVAVVREAASLIRLHNTDPIL